VPVRAVRPPFRTARRVASAAAKLQRLLRWVTLERGLLVGSDGTARLIWSLVAFWRWSETGFAPSIRAW